MRSFGGSQFRSLELRYEHGECALENHARIAAWNCVPQESLRAAEPLIAFTAHGELYLVAFGRKRLYLGRRVVTAAA